MIQLYKANNTNYEFNGDMILQPISCNLKMELDTALNEIEMLHPLDPEGRWREIDYDDIISVPTPYKNLEQQLYRVYDKVKNTSSIKIKARHIFYDLLDTLLIDVRPTNKTGQQALKEILSNTKFTGYSNISKVNTAYYIRKNIIEAIGGNDDNSFLNRWGGEIFLDNYNVYINNRVGGDYGVRITCGKNLTGIEENINLDSVATRIVPVGFDGIMLDGLSPYVDSPLINNYANIKMREIKYDDVKVKQDENDEEGFDTLAEAQAELIRRVKEDYANGIDKPLVNYKVEFVDLTKIEQYKDYAILEEVLLGDTVYIKHNKLNIELEARVIKIEYDCVRDKYINIELGNYSSSYAKDKANITNKVNNVLNSNGSLNASAIQGFIDSTNTKIFAQKQIGQKQDVRAIIFEDLDTSSPTFGCVMLGTQGIMVSKERTLDNKDWVFTSALTSEGLIADKIVGNVLSAKDGSSRFELNTGRFYFGDILEVHPNGMYINTGDWNTNSYSINSDGISRRTSPTQVYHLIWYVHAFDILVPVGSTGVTVTLDPAILRARDFTYSYGITRSYTGDSYFAQHQVSINDFIVNKTTGKITIKVTNKYQVANSDGSYTFKDGGTVGVSIMVCGWG